MRARVCATPFLLPSSDHTALTPIDTVTTPDQAARTQWQYCARATNRPQARGGERCQCIMVLPCLSTQPPARPRQCGSVTGEGGVKRMNALKGEGAIPLVGTRTAANGARTPRARAPTNRRRGLEGMSSLAVSRGVRAGGRVESERARAGGTSGWVDQRPWWGGPRELQDCEQL